MITTHLLHRYYLAKVYCLYNIQNVNEINLRYALLRRIVKPRRSENDDRHLLDQ